MTDQTKEVVSESVENIQVAGILYKLIWASWCAYLFVLLTGLYYNDSILILAMLIGSALLLIPFILVRRGHVQFSSLITIVLVISTVTFIAVVGQGIRDIAIISFPIIIIFAGLILNRRLFGICVGLTIVAAIGLVFGEGQGWFVTKPFNGTNSNLFYLLGITVILLIAALAADLLAKNVRKTRNLTQQEVSNRKRVETQNRIISEVQDNLLRPFKLEDVYKLVSEKVWELIGDCITVTSILEAKHGKIRLCSYHGLDVPLEKLLPILGFDPLGKEFSMDEITEEDFKLYRSGKLGIMEGGFHAFTAHQVPKPASLIIEKLLRVQKIYAMGFIHNKEFLGSLAILARGDISPNLGTIEQIMNMATIAIDRKRAEEEVETSEKRFHALIEHGRDNISLLAADGTLLWENPSAFSTLGYDKNQHVGRNIFELIHPDDQEWARNMFIQVSQVPGNFLEGETRLMHSEGTWRWIQCSATNLLDDPSVQAIVLNYRDITESKLAKETILESETRYKTLFENSPVALWEEDFSPVIIGLEEIGLQGESLRSYLDDHPLEVIHLISKLVILDVNRATLQLYGVRDKNELMKNTARLFSNVSHEQLAVELMAMSVRNPNFENTVDNSRADGKIINVRVRWSVYPGHETDMSRVIVNTVDITQQIQAISVQSAIY
jgi:PAS domain S-box-containing protein